MSDPPEMILGSKLGGISPPDSASADMSETEALRSLLSIHDRFVLASAVCNNLAIQRALIADLRRCANEIALIRLQVDQDEDPFSLADRDAPPQPNALFVTGLTDWLSDPQKRLDRAHRLNASRERWIERFRCPVVLWMNESTAHLLAQHAPDLWRYRNHRFEFEWDRGTAVDGFLSNSAVTGGAAIEPQSAKDARERIAELQRRVESLPANAPLPLLATANVWRNEVGILQFQLGELDLAQHAWRSAMEVDEQLGDDEGRAGRLGNLGLIAYTRGDLDEAVKLHSAALQILRNLGQLEGQASNLCNLGMIARIRGNLDEAEKLHREALEIDRKLGHLEGQASDLGNLGLVAESRGDLDEAERLLVDSLEIERKLGRVGGEANSLVNLGVIAQLRGDLNRAEKMLWYALEIDRRLGRLIGQAASLGNLGVVAEARGDLDKAEEFYRQALELERSVGRLQGSGIALGKLGVLAGKRGRLDEAEKFLREALAIERKLGSLEGQARNLANLGNIAKQRGNLEARRLWSESRELCTRIGMPQKVRQLQALLDHLPSN